MDEPVDVERTLALLRSECETCGAWGVFTGRTERGADQHVYAVVRCPQEGVEFTVWSARGDAVLEAYERARAVSRADLDLVRRVADALATLTGTPTADDVRAAAAVPLDPPPLGAAEVRVDGGRIPVVELSWTTPELRRADLDGLFGVGRWLPRVHPGTPHQLGYDAATADSHVVVFGSFDPVPEPESVVTRLMWRVDLPSPG
jgi:hypothetical protein